MRKHKTRNMIAGLLPVALIVSACGVDVGVGPHPSLRQPAAVTAEENDDQTQITSLPPREMQEGECTVFLWSEENSRPLVYVQNIAAEHSTMLINSRSVDLERQQASDMIIPGFYARQSFTSDTAELTVRLKPEAGRNLYEGIKIPAGILTVKNQDQSQSIVSVSGLLGCNLS